MAFTRRNAIIGLGALAGGVGVIGGTGAFTSVEADRTVSVSTTGDGSANLALTGDPEITGTETEAGVDLLTIENVQINERARTRFDDAITVTNNGSEVVGFYIDDDPSPEPLGFEVGGASIVGEGNAVSVGVGNSVSFDLTIDLGPSEVDGSDLDAIDSVTFVADTGAQPE